MFTDWAEVATLRSSSYFQFGFYRSVNWRNRLQKNLRSGKTEIKIIEVIKKKALDEYYAQTIADNFLEDKGDKKSFWKLLILGCLLTIISAYLYFLPKFYGY